MKTKPSTAMGQCTSHSHHTSLPKCACRTFCNSKSGSLSATFHILDSNLRWDQLNVNTATEEELMTLPGVNRTTARNIIDYRQTIGGFKKIEDLALVSGVGASKLEQFRSEVCVGTRRRGYESNLSSGRQSLESLNNSEVFSRIIKSSPLKLINVNMANVFQLMSVHGMNQETAANIVHYRECKGPFKSVDELLKVKGMTQQKLATLRLFLTVDPYNLTTLHSSSSCGTPQITSSKRASPFIRRANSAISHLGFKKNPSSTKCTNDEIYEFLAKHSERPVPPEVFLFQRDKRPALRIASWNLENFTTEKAKNPGVREVICRTILENGFSLVALQEIASRDALATIVSELNDPQLSKVQMREGERGHWQSVLPLLTPSSPNSMVSWHCGFLYDTSHGLDLRDSTFISQLGDNKSSQHIQSFLGWFKIGTLDFMVINFKLPRKDEGDINGIHISKILSSVMKQFPGEKNILLLGHIPDYFQEKGKDVLSSTDCSILWPSDAIIETSDKGHDSIIVASNSLKSSATGYKGVVKEGLTHLAIPCGWSWGGPVSHYCPVWVELFAEETNSTSMPVTNGIRNIEVTPESNADEVTTKPAVSDKNNAGGNKAAKKLGRIHLLRSSSSSITQKSSNGTIHQMESKPQNGSL